ncbi:MAG: hypothetical protein LBU23_09040 [Planctomycetota bacterium]|nr:hypothetical protein [Planctomycetota bacterium]
MLLDIRTSPEDKASSLAVNAKPVGEDGKASVVVEDDKMEGAPAFLTLIDAAGRVVLRAPVIIGGVGHV